MKVDVNIDHLIQKEIDAMSATYEYMKSSKVLYEKRGYGVNIDHPVTKEERHIAYAYHNDQKESDAMWDIAVLLGLSTNARRRLSAAARALFRWYQKTGWQKNPSEELIERLGRYIVG